MRTSEGVTRSPAKRRVLVVEDNPLLMRVLTELFQMEGFHVETATDGEDAVSTWAQRGPFDLVLCDVLLPKRRGTDVADVIIRTDPRTHVILWSGHPPDRLTFEGSPRVRFVQKPLDAEQLMAVVKEVLANE